MKARFPCRTGLIGLLLFVFLELSPVSFGFNNDGKTDIVWRRASTGNPGETAVWYMNGTAYNWSASMPAVPDLDWKMVGSADFNKDGQLDILWRHQTTGLNCVWTMSGGNYLDTVWLQSAPDINWEIVATGYFNGRTDKFIDILWRNKITGDNAIWFMDGLRFSSAALIQEALDLNWKIGGSGDLNSDGFTDIVWRHATTGINAVWYMQGVTLVGTATFQSEPNPGWEIVGTGYFSGLNDNTIDILWRYKTTGDNAIWQMSGINLLSATAIAWAHPSWLVGGTGDSAVDTDSDGMPDVWEKRYFGNLDHTANADFDNDGFSNNAERSSGTDPTIAGGSTPLISDALESPELLWTTISSSGQGHWGVGGGEITASCAYISNYLLSPGANSLLQTTFNGPGTFRFYWRTAYPSGYGGFGAYIDDSLIVSGPSSSWQLSQVTVGPGPHTFKAILWYWNSYAQGYVSAYLDVAQFLPDTDQNGLDDYWEFKHFGSLNQDPALDPDSDGLSNLQESQNGTNPKVTESSYTEIAKATMSADASDYYVEYDGEEPVTWWEPWNAIDGTQYDPGWRANNNTSWLRINLGSSKPVARLKYRSRDNEWNWAGTMSGYRIYVTDSASTNPEAWGYPVAEGYWTWPTKPATKTVDFTPKTGRYVILEAGPSGSWGEVAANEIWLYQVAAAPSISDSDLDELPDAWEQQYFGNLTSQSSGGDPDGDGLLNGDEYRGGTNPTEFSGLEIFTQFE